MGEEILHMAFYTNALGRVSVERTILRFCSRTHSIPDTLQMIPWEGIHI